MLACGGVRRYPNSEIVVWPHPALRPTELPPTVVGGPRGQAIERSRLGNRRFCLRATRRREPPYAHTVSIDHGLTFGRGVTTLERGGTGRGAREVTPVDRRQTGNSEPT